VFSGGGFVAGTMEEHYRVALARQQDHNLAAAYEGRRLYFQTIQQLSIPYKVSNSAERYLARLLQQSDALRSYGSQDGLTAKMKDESKYSGTKKPSGIFNEDVLRDLLGYRS